MRPAASAVTQALIYEQVSDFGLSRIHIGERTVATQTYGTVSHIIQKYDTLNLSSSPLFRSCVHQSFS